MMEKLDALIAEIARLRAALEHIGECRLDPSPATTSNGG